MRVIIAGGRDFCDYQRLCNIMSKCPYTVSEVVCGGARGADYLGGKWGIDQGISVKYFPADWEKHGKKAGHLRNTEMGDYADALVAFWDKKSKGTKHMIDYATKLGLKVNVFYY